jgi:hypothetical protein
MSVESTASARSNRGMIHNENFVRELKAKARVARIDSISDDE